MSSADQVVVFEWRGSFSNEEINRLHAEAFETRLFDESEWNWRELTARHSLGWVAARTDGALLGFVNVLWDGLVHAWIQDLMVARAARRRRIGVRLVQAARDEAVRAGCDFFHVDFDERLRRFYIDECGFKTVCAGLIELLAGSEPKVRSLNNLKTREGFGAGPRLRGFSTLAEAAHSFHRSVPVWA